MCASLAKGNFMVELDLQSAEGTSILKAARSVRAFTSMRTGLHLTELNRQTPTQAFIINTPQSVQLLDMFLRLPFVLFMPLRSTTQRIVVPLVKQHLLRTFMATPVAQAVVQVGRHDAYKGETCGSSTELQVYAAKLLFKARLRGFRCVCCQSLCFGRQVVDCDCQQSLTRVLASAYTDLSCITTASFPSSSSLRPFSRPPSSPLSAFGVSCSCDLLSPAVKRAWPWINGPTLHHAILGRPTTPQRRQSLQGRRRQQVPLVRLVLRQARLPKGPAERRQNGNEKRRRRRQLTDGGT